VEVLGRFTSYWICVLGPSEQKNMRLRFVDFIVGPSSRLHDAEGSPLSFTHQFALVGNLLVDVLGKHDMAVLVEVIAVLIGVLNLSRIVRHLLLLYFEK
jgi:hypothetical protein